MKLNHFKYSAIALFYLISACSNGSSSPNLNVSGLNLNSTSFPASKTLSFSTANADQKSLFSENFGCAGGTNTSPQLTWTPASGAQSYAITFYDQDAPTESGFWHAVYHNIPATKTSFAAGELSGLKPDNNLGIVVAKNDGGTQNYYGFCPPAGPTHRYIYTVYALSTPKLSFAALGGDLTGTQTPELTGFALWANKPIASSALTISVSQ